MSLCPCTSISLASIFTSIPPLSISASRNPPSVLASSHPSSSSLLSRMPDASRPQPHAIAALCRRCLPVATTSSSADASVTLDGLNSILVTSFASSPKHPGLYASSNFRVACHDDSLDHMPLFPNNSASFIIFDRRKLDILERRCNVRKVCVVTV